jgi:hypothetical protein
MPYLTTQIPPLVNVGTYYKAPTQIFFTSSTISQPVTTLEYLIPGVRDVTNYFKAPSAIFIGNNTIGQPTGFISTLITGVRKPLLSLPVVVPPGIASWLQDTISQPFAKKQFFPLYDVNQLSYPGFIRLPQAYLPPGVASWLSSTIQQPYMVPYPQQPSITFIKVPTVIPPTGYASWIGSTIGQPYIVATNNNGTVWNLSFLRAYNPAIATLITRLLTGVGL